jgi:hypothetical protein
MRETIPSSARQWGMWCHLSSLAWLLFPIRFISLGLPLIIWLLKRDEHAFVNEQGKESLNFQLSVLLYEVAIAVVWGIAAFVIFGSALFAAPAIASSETAGFTLFAGLGILLLAPILLLGLLGIFAAIAAIVAALKASEGQVYRYPIMLRFLK